MHYIKLADIIRERRETLKITQEDLAELSGVALRTIKAIETAKGNPTLQTINNISDVLGLELDLSLKRIRL
ncbi:TPA: transcriptional regulator [Candidatus Delongbacteria bacterium]|nr:transcriptional regulator [Candidatus Delongbacteria bacterium]